MDNSKNFLGEFGNAIMQIAEEKGIDKAKVITVVEAALAAAYKKEYGKRGQNIRADFDEKTADVKFFLLKEVVDDTVRDFTVWEDIEESHSDKKHKVKKIVSIVSNDDEKRLVRFNEERDIVIEDAKNEKKDANVGDIIEFSLPTKTEFGRVAAQTAKQVVIQRVREAERESMYEEYKEYEHEIVSAVVRRIEGRTIFVDLGKANGVLFPSEQIQGEFYTVGMRIKVYVMSVSQDPKGPGITVSRTHSDLVRRLFELEVPEIFAGTVEIKAISREAGSRAKVAVYTEEDGVDPIGSCVGQRGTRVQTIIDELGGEKMDIIEWSDNMSQFITMSLSPAKVINVELDEEKKEAVAIVPDDQLSLAIGKKGQNVRLAVKLTGWNIDVVGAGAQEDLKDNEMKDLKDLKDSQGKESEDKEKKENNKSEDIKVVKESDSEREKDESKEDADDK